MKLLDFFSVKDSRGANSRTLAFCTASWATLTVKFAIGGLTLPYLGIQPPMTGTEYAAAFLSILGIWTAREWGEKGTLQIGGTK